ncbi:tail fiber domain-containing protein [Myxococcus sp. K38C18041901]|uniref:tail fiber domain-containing protein n=1 Tax=Myxococcus guangdongensis TaxID=2906760 RepID=UPI0020A6F249|nr:tail fiber domain-containing protein [Myxococcus guangdongensis]MCP3060340.1 tail fiber domain-containing protein [Myxococcus guangdongensis]
MNDPYYPARPGDAILADTWNNMQVKTREEIRGHTHRGGADGKQLAGDSISPSAMLKVTRVEATENLVVKNTDVTARFLELENQKLALTGGALSGPLTVNANVGIGAAPGTKRLLVVAPVSTEAPPPLEVRTTGSQTWGIGLVIKTTAGTEGASMLLRTRTKSWQVRGQSGAGASGLQITEDGGDSETGSGSGTPRLHIKAGGNVGINTDDPQGALDVRVPGGSAGLDRFVVNLTTNWSTDIPHVTIGAGLGNGLMIHNPHVSWDKGESRASIRYGMTGGTATGVYWDVGARVDNGFSFMVNNTTTMFMNESGNLGIGTTRPSTPLHVQQRAGNLGIRLSENVSGRFVDMAMEGQGTFHIYHSNGNGRYMPQDGEWHKFSDVQLKDNIQTLEGILPRVLALRPVSFDLKSSGHHQLGLIAQEVEPVFPELVSDAPAREDGTPLKGLAYEALNVLAIAALQELKAHYDTRIAALEQRLLDPEKHG